MNSSMIDSRDYSCVGRQDEKKFSQIGKTMTPGESSASRHTLQSSPFNHKTSEMNSMKSLVMKRQRNTIRDSCIKSWVSFHDNETFLTTNKRKGVKLENRTCNRRKHPCFWSWSTSCLSSSNYTVFRGIIITREWTSPSLTMMSFRQR